MFCFLCTQDSDTVQWTCRTVIGTNSKMNFNFNNVDIYLATWQWVNIHNKQTFIRHNNRASFSSRGKQITARQITRSFASPFCRKKSQRNHVFQHFRLHWNLNLHVFSPSTGQLLRQKASKKGGQPSVAASEPAAVWQEQRNFDSPVLRIAARNMFTSERCLVFTSILPVLGRKVKAQLVHNETPQCVLWIS